MSLFRINWIQIDTIIIVLLVLFLISVEIYRQISRWRYSLSNQSLNSKSFKVDVLKNKNKTILKKIKIITNSNSVKNKANPIVIFLRTNFHRIIPKIITEGLASYGFDILTAKYGKKPKTNNKSIEMELKQELSELFDKLRQKKIVNTQNYFLLIFSKSKIPYKQIFIDNSNVGMVLINPNLNKLNINYINEILELDNNKENKITMFFSKFSLFIFPNLHLRKFKRLFIKETDFTNRNEFYVIKNARYSFKYYETILIGNIIQILEKNLEKSQI
ncbi:MAG: hypothetical protein KGD63_12920 [Candidatus Lokiarchaeota archaeon]|nr:hypothetical protein [Candidatus Lokiarchaeota archaeon]